MDAQSIFVSNNIYCIPSALHCNINGELVKLRTIETLIPVDMVDDEEDEFSDDDDVEDADVDSINSDSSNSNLDNFEPLNSLVQNHSNLLDNDMALVQQCREIVHANLGALNSNLVQSLNGLLSSAQRKEKWA